MLGPLPEARKGWGVIRLCRPGMWAAKRVIACFRRGSIRSVAARRDAGAARSTMRAVQTLRVCREGTRRSSLRRVFYCAQSNTWRDWRVRCSGCGASSRPRRRRRSGARRSGPRAPVQGPLPTSRARPCARPRTPAGLAPPVDGITERFSLAAPQRLLGRLRPGPERKFLHEIRLWADQTPAFRPKYGGDVCIHNPGVDRRVPGVAARSTTSPDPSTGRTVKLLRGTVTQVNR